MINYNSYKQNKLVSEAKNSESIVFLKLDVCFSKRNKFKLQQLKTKSERLRKMKQQMLIKEISFCNIEKYIYFKQHMNKNKSTLFSL